MKGAFYLLIPQSIVDEAKEKYGQRAVEIIVEDLKIQDFDERALKGICPFHDERTPSFVWYDTGNYFKCHGCGKVYGYIDHQMEFYKLTYVEAVEKLLSEVGSDYRVTEKGVKTDRQYKYPNYIKSDNRDIVEKYMNQRKISPETLDYCDVQQSDDINGNIVFNYYDENDVLVTVKLRPSRKIPKGDIKTWCQKDSDTKNVLFNMNRVDPSKPLIITEGECFRGDTEILTRNGWVRLDRYFNKAVDAKNRQVLQVDDSLAGRFVEPLAFIKKSITGTISSYEATAERSFSTNILQSTPNHNIISITQTGKLIKQKMSSLKERANPISIPQSVVTNGKGLNLTKSQLTLQLICIGSSAKFDHKKSRTYCRYYYYGHQGRYDYVKSLLKSLNIDHFEVTDPEVTDRPYIGFIKPDYIHAELPIQFAIDATLKEKQTIIQLLLKLEARHRNGVRNMEVFIESDQNAEVLDTLFHLTGMNARITNKGGYNRILIRATNATGNMPREYREYDFDGRVYCVTVPSGMILIRQNGTIFVVGNCDALAVIEAGSKNTVSIPFGASNEKWIDTNWDFLEQFPHIILWYDNDTPGEKARKSVMHRLGVWKVSYVQVPPEVDGKKIKDANEVLFNFGKEKVLEFIENAIEPEIEGILDFSDIEDYDIESAEALYTGIKPVDDFLYKIVFGTVSIITGKSGGGKSVLMNQIGIAEPLNQGHNAFIFSGELAPRLLKPWILFQLAGRDNIIEHKKHAKHVKPEVKATINKWAKGRLSIYDFEKNMNFSADSILEKMEILARRKNVRVFVLDNLMTIDLGCDQENQNKKQKEFVLQCVSFARTFNVIVFIVAHPRKGDGKGQLQKEDVAGSGDITNLAHYVFSTRKYTPNEKAGVQNPYGAYEKNCEPVDHDVQLTVLKNRVTGGDNKSFDLWYDERSMRFYSDASELNKRYRWDTDRSPISTINPKEPEKPELIA